MADSATRPFDGFAQRKRQFAKPPFDPVHLDIRKVLTVYTRRALVRVMVKRIGGRVSINVKRAPLGGFTRGLGTGQLEHFGYWDRERRLAGLERLVAQDAVDRIAPLPAPDRGGS